MTKKYELMVFDRFYKGTHPLDEIRDTVGNILDPDTQDVVLHTSNLPDAMMAIKAIADGNVAAPHAIITGGVLTNQLEYTYHPETFSYIEDVTVKRFRKFGREITKHVPREVALMPHLDDDGNFSLARLPYDRYSVRVPEVNCLSAFVITRTLGCLEQLGAINHIPVIVNSSFPIDTVIAPDATLSKLATGEQGQIVGDRDQHFASNRDLLNVLLSSFPDPQA